MIGMSICAVTFALQAMRPLDRFLKDESIIEIMINGEKPVIVERLGERPAETEVLLNELQIKTIITHLSSLSRREVDLHGGGGMLVVSARLPGYRVEAQLPPVAVDGPYISIRAHTSQSLTLDDYVARGAITDGVREYLGHAVRAHRNILVVGGTSSGKTTFLNALIREIDRGERLLAIETIPELIIPHRNVVRLEADEEQGYSVQRLLKSALRSRPDRVLVGEVRGGEAFDFVDAANTGHPGAMGTIHANSGAEGLDRLESLALEGRPTMPLAAIRKRIAQTFQVIVYMDRRVIDEKVVRGLGELLEIGGLDPSGGDYLTTHIFKKEHQ
jgi:pilus assembly protein CpaF